MAEVTLLIGGRPYQIACADGEEDALRHLGTIVDEQINSARLMTGGLTETRQLLFAAILLADKLNSTPHGSSDNGIIQDDKTTISKLDEMTARLDAVTARLSALG